MIYERHPGIEEVSVSLYTHRAAGYNPLAMEIRTRCQQKTPVGVPVAENGFGDLFWDFVSDVVPTLLGHANPIFAAAGYIGKKLIKGYKPNPGVATKVAPPPMKVRKALPQGGNTTLVARRPVNTRPVKIAVPVGRTAVIPAGPSKKAKRKARRALQNRGGWEVVDERIPSKY